MGVNEWIDEGAEAHWSFTHPTDAQRASLIFLAGAFVFILIFWQGKVPYGWRTVTMLNTRTGEKHTRRRARVIPFLILMPFKILTVLYHEIGHAVVGQMTIWYKESRAGVPPGGERGRILYIMVDKYEGGRTEFTGSTRPIDWLTLPAGYIGSCLVGCWFLFTGFDAKWSKIGALTLALITFVSTLICFFVRGKAGITHQWHRIASFVWRWVLCNKRRSDKALRKHKHQRDMRNEHARWRLENDPDGPTEHDLHASQDLIITCSLVVGMLIWAVWEWDDSNLLRYVMLFMGLLSALYTVWDIIQDGIKYATVAESDATRMAKLHNQRKKEKTGVEGTRGVRFYAVQWLLLEIIVILLVILLAYCVFRRNKEQQAVESTEFLPAQFHYGGDDLAKDASTAGGSVEGWLGHAD
ncbi:hypothetical protein IAU60_002999 [Kwoniella sp. DSM 27419]